MANRQRLEQHDELTETAFSAIQSLSPIRKANLLLDTSLSLIAAGQSVSSILPALSCVAEFVIGEQVRRGSRKLPSSVPPYS